MYPANLGVKCDQNLVIPAIIGFRPGLPLLNSYPDSIGSWVGTKAIRWHKIYPSQKMELTPHPMVGVRSTVL